MEGVDEVSGRKWWAIHREAGVQAQCMMWMFAHFEVLGVVDGGLGGGRKFHGRARMQWR